MTGRAAAKGMIIPAAVRLFATMRRMDMARSAEEIKKEEIQRSELNLVRPESRQY